MARRITSGTLGRSVLGSIVAEDNALITVLTNDSIILDPNGTGLVESTSIVSIQNNQDLRLQEETANGSNYIALKSPASVTANATYVLPDSVAITNNYVLKTDASGNLTWIRPYIKVSETADTASNWNLIITQATAADITDAYVASSRLSFQPSTGVLSATTFSGALQTTQSQQINSLGVNTAASATAGEIRATGDITAHFSDERLKTITGKIENALDKVAMINGYYFVENEKAKELGYNNDSLQVGVNAQEVEKVLPEVVTGAPINANFEGADYKTVRYEKLVPLLIEAIKELKEIVDKNAR